MDDAEHAIAVLERVHDHPKAKNIRHLLEGDRFALHLGPDGIGPFLATLHRGADIVFGETLGKIGLDRVDERAVAGPEIGEPLRHHGMRIRHQMAEGKIFQFLAHILHAHAPGERSIDIERLLGDARAFLLRHVVQRAHIVQPVGKLDEQHAHIFGNGKQQLAEIFGLRGFLRHEIELLDLRQTIDQRADILAEDLVDLFSRRLRILDRVVQHCGNDGRIVELQIGEDGGDFEWMREVRVARGALLAAMRLHGVDISAVQQVFVGVLVVALDALHKLILAHHGRATPFKTTGNEDSLLKARTRYTRAQKKRATFWPLSKTFLSIFG